MTLFEDDSDDDSLFERSLSETECVADVVGVTTLATVTEIVGEEIDGVAVRVGGCKIDADDVVSVVGVCVADDDASIVGVPSDADEENDSE